MKYISTRGADEGFDSAMAIKAGISSDGGLFVPEKLPVFSIDEIERMKDYGYKEIAGIVLSSLFDDFSPAEIGDYIDLAYSEDKFGENPAPLIQLNKYNDREHILELWHGPTGAFKDIALQLLPHLMTAAIAKTGEHARICILAATSGDTGKAALEGFRDVEGTQAVVFYPQSGVSEAQRLQMVTQEGGNCHVVAVKGCFDDTQTGVKDIFSDKELAAELQKAGIILSSANSINWGRLAPQIVYYFSSYAHLLAGEKILKGEKINIVVPTGNFGNILSAWYAMKMGLPVNKLICASNKNKVLSDFLRNGTYDTGRDFYRTNSPSMDILISSNLERLMFEITDRNPLKVRTWMEDLKSKGVYTIDPVTLKKIQEVFVGGFAEDSGTVKTIREVYDKYDHCVDTHTAVGFNVYERYFARSGDLSRTIFVSTANPLKFAGAVCDAIFGDGYRRGRSEEVLLRELSEEIGVEIPATLAGLSSKAVLHDTVIEKSQMGSTVREYLLKEN
ncbi:MAG: threonine synthase [Saccharofermentanales bacterium]